MNDTKITNFPLRAPVVEQFALELKALVSNYFDRLSVAEAVGALEVVKLETFNEQQTQELAAARNAAFSEGLRSIELEEKLNERTALTEQVQPAQGEPLFPFKHGCKWCGKSKCSITCPGVY
tara:strand:+ start:76 stop:441 length:366 start_codon:yes stop_codon:yes gene_type:complete